MISIFFDILKSCIWIILCVGVSFGQKSIDNLSEYFVEVPVNWEEVGDVLWDYEESEFEKLIPGEGVFINRPSRESHGHLVTKDSFSDLEVEFDFMMYKNSNSGIYLMGRYEVQLFDSWMVDRPSFSDCGGVYQRWDENKNEDKGYEGVPPLINACKAPGLWQNMKIIFKAPKFDSFGKKIQNARFEKVFLNGELVQDRVEVTGPTRAALFSDEKEQGPLMIQGDHGKIAIRNFKYKSFELSDTLIPNSWVIDPIKIKSDGVPYVLRSFVKHKDEKLSYAVSVGMPEKLNYTYDTNQGSLIQLWRGGFMDVTDMWFRRGEPQTASPLGLNLILPNEPVFVTIGLNGNLRNWPTSYSSEKLIIEGYSLDSKGYPTFKYRLGQTKFKDRIIPRNDNKGLKREILLDNPNHNKKYVRVAVGREIIELSKNRFRIDGRYYIDCSEVNPIEIFKRAEDEELLLEFYQTESEAQVTYSIIW